MRSDPVAVLAERVRSGATGVEVLVVAGPPGWIGRRWAYTESGEVLAGDVEALGGRRVAEALRGLGPDRRSTLVTLPGDEGFELYLERWAPPPRLVVFGGGHIGRAIAAGVRDLDFVVTVVEDRAYFADPGRFEGGVECLQCPLPEGPDRLDLGPEDYVVVATRGHAEDLGCVRSALIRRPFYLGLLGSRRKLREFRELLASEGHDPEALAAVRCPVGLAIGAETPAEIAVAVAAELIAARAGRLPA